MDHKRAAQLKVPLVYARVPVLDSPRTQVAHSKSSSMAAADHRNCNRPLLLTMPSMTHSTDLPPGYGPQPRLPEAQESWLPTIKWSVTNKPWPKGATPKAAHGLAVQAFAQGLKHPRWLHVLSKGDVLA